MANEGNAFGVMAKKRSFAMLATSAACFLLALFFLFALHTKIVYTHLFYIPLLLAGMWYYRKAIYVALGLGVVHIVILYFSLFSIAADDLARGVIFITIAYTVGYVSEKRAQDEEALRAQDESYRTFFKTSKDPIFITSKDGRWLDFNDEAVTLFGYDNRDELQEVRIPDLYEDPEERKKHIKLIEQQGFTKDYPVNLRKRDGSIINVLITSSARKDENGTVIGYQGTIRDISERTRAEEVYHHLVENSADGIVVTGRDGIVRFANPMAENIFGCTVAELKGELFGFPIVVGESTEIELIRRDGGEKYTGEMHVTKTDWEGERAYLLSIRDITDRKRMENEREHILQELEIKHAELEQFVYTISHELKTPLVTLQGYSDLLLRDMAENRREEMETDLKFIKSAVTTMALHLKETLELSRIGRVVNPAEDVPFGDIVEEALERSAEYIAVSAVEIVGVREYPLVHVDRVKIREALMNLIENSIQFMGDQPEPKIEIGYRLESKETVFFVKDNGMGLAKSQHEKVFGLFYRADTRSEGSGVGLTIVKRIIEVHGGRIWIESEKGKGCAVCFTLPTAQ